MQLIVGKMSLQDDIDQIEKLESLDIEEINKRFWKGYETSVSPSKTTKIGNKRKFKILLCGAQEET